MFFHVTKQLLSGYDSVTKQRWTKIAESNPPKLCRDFATHIFDTVESFALSHRHIIFDDHPWFPKHQSMSGPETHPAPSLSIRQYRQYENLDSSLGYLVLYCCSVWCGASGFFMGSWRVRHRVASPASSADLLPGDIAARNSDGADDCVAKDSCVTACTTSVTRACLHRLR